MEYSDRGVPCSRATSTSILPVNWQAMQSSGSSPFASGVAGSEAEGHPSLTVDDFMFMSDVESPLFAGRAGSMLEEKPSLTISDYLQRHDEESSLEESYQSAAFLTGACSEEHDPSPEHYYPALPTTAATVAQAYGYQLDPFLWPSTSNLWELSAGSIGAQAAEGSYNYVDGRSKFVFRTQSEKDVLEDGYKWRKYGKKSVKNSTYKR